MIDYLRHIYRKGSTPFRSISGLTEQEAVAIMTSLYTEGAIFWERFEDPAGYLAFRRQVERNVRIEFVKKGGKPKDAFPIYMMVGTPKWTTEMADSVSLSTTEDVCIPAGLLDMAEVSFTYPDSMVSTLVAAEKNPDYYEPDYHGHVFTFREMEQILKVKGMPGEGWETRMPKRFAHYVEAQIWNREALLEAWARSGRSNNRG